ncbi:MAG: SnoaL-like polyketide cyclase [Chloroflexi bacterium OLB15]|nr:MAG: SnoaL-like polyketide cyclase [Chloroflexi bacterium OLB15]
MSGEENKALVRRYLDAISGKPKPTSILDQFLSDEILKRHIAETEFGFPNYEIIAEEMLADGDKVMVKVLIRGVHRGNFMGIPATGKQIEALGALIYTITNGKISDHWMLADSMTMMQQLGVIPVQEA